ncbi:hypothetical protein [Butyrivibrio sp. YAB3001]|uniref:hypothetical protein n=1 Tax=Butyrivibrio sp. YAB3001 TaxID=1520812 RepID=UPI0008F62103|nr:hypothetical protein [Butyrivibrio sp. YAB3001]SFC68361.1 hypothetical protein SAMN02910398_02851 [Butyrivibrio sp. YAB3001]
MKKELRPLFIFLTSLIVWETLLPFLPEWLQYMLDLLFMVTVIVPCFAIITYVVGVRTGRYLSGKAIERFLLAVTASILITIIIRPYHIIINNFFSFGTIPWFFWVFFNKTNGVIAIIIFSLFWIGEEVGCRRVKDSC